MPRRFQRGSGTTAQQVVEWTDEEIGNDPSFFEHLKGMRQSFTQYLDAMEQSCKTVLTKAGLPTERSLEFFDGAWVKAGEIKSNRRFANRQHVILDVLKCEPDSQEGFSVRVLETIDDLRAALARNRVMVIAEKAYELGRVTTQWSLKRLADPGLAQIAAARKNSEASNRRVSIKAAKRWKPAREEAAKLRAAHPDWKDNKIAGEVKRRLELQDAQSLILRAIKKIV